jgi:hypothetical protein
LADEPKSLDDVMDAKFAEINARDQAPTNVSAAPDAPAASVEPAVSAAPDATDAPSGDRARGPDGKFLPKPAEAATAATAPPITDRAEPTAATAAPSTAQAVTPPVSWSAEAKAAWNALPPAVQQAALKREQEVSSGFAQKTAELKEYEPLKSILGPRQHLLAAEYGSVANGLQTLFSLSEFAAKDAPGFVKWFAQQRGIDLSSLAGTPAGQPQVSADPTIAALQQQIGSLTTEIQTAKQQREQAEQVELGRQIDAFKADPKHVHFEAVRAHMAALMQSGAAKDMQDAYDQAVYANPETRRLVMEEQRAADEAKRAADNAKSAAEAIRIRETNQATTGVRGASPSKARSWDETMEEKHKALSAA